MVDFTGAPVFIGKALFSYSASQDDDISFEKDDEIEVIGEIREI